MASENQGKPWIQIVTSLIAGGAVVLAALLPILYSSNKRLETATKVADSEGEAMKHQIADLGARLKACETEKNSPTKGNPPAPVPAGDPRTGWRRKDQLQF